MKLLVDDSFEQTWDFQSFSDKIETRRGRAIILHHVETVLITHGVDGRH